MEQLIDTWLSTWPQAALLLDLAVRVGHNPLIPRHVANMESIFTMEMPKPIGDYKVLERIAGNWTVTGKARAL